MLSAVGVTTVVLSPCHWSVPSVATGLWTLPLPVLASAFAFIDRYARLLHLRFPIQPGSLTVRSDVTIGGGGGGKRR